MQDNIIRWKLLLSVTQVFPKRRGIRHHGATILTRTFLIKKTKHLMENGQNAGKRLPLSFYFSLIFLKESSVPQAQIVK